MRVVFGIGVSKASSEVAILVNGEKIHGYTIPNDAIGFTHAAVDLRQARDCLVERRLHAGALEPVRLLRSSLSYPWSVAYP